MNARLMIFLTPLFASLLGGCGDRQAERSVAPGASATGGAMRRPKRTAS